MASLSSTSARNFELVANKQGCGRRARPHAARSARCARYPLRPPLPATSRDTVDGARPSRLAITRNDSPRATPREISSRSTSDRCRSARRRGGGRTPPASSNSRRIDDPFLPRRRAIDRVSSPACRRSHTSAISASVNLLDTPHLPTRNHNSRRRCCVHALRRQAICATSLRSSRGPQRPTIAWSNPPSRWYGWRVATESNRRNYGPSLLPGGAIMLRRSCSRSGIGWEPEAASSAAETSSRRLTKGALKRRRVVPSLPQRHRCLRAANGRVRAG